MNGKPERGFKLKIVKVIQLNHSYVQPSDIKVKSDIERKTMRKSQR